MTKKESNSRMMGVRVGEQVFADIAAVKSHWSDRGRRLTVADIVAAAVADLRQRLEARR